MANKPRVNNDSTNFAPGQMVRNPLAGYFGFAADVPRAKVQNGLGSGWDPLRDIMNFGGDLLTGFTRNQRESYGTGLGDLAFGVSPGYYQQRNAPSGQGRNLPLYQTIFPAQNNTPKADVGRVTGERNYNPNNRPYLSGNRYNGTPAGNQTDLGGGMGSPMSWADALGQARAFLSELGVGGSVSYDPLRQQARSQWTDADARTKAMFEQLQGGIGELAAPLSAAYDTGVANTNAATQYATDQQAQSAQSMTDMLTQQAQALGIEEAVVNDANRGNLALQDRDAAAAANAARGQITSNLLNENKVTALDRNTDLQGAAGLAGTMARLQRQNELSRLLAGYDVQEQEANAQGQRDFLSQSLGLAGDILGTDRDDFKLQTELQRYATQDRNEMERFFTELPYKYGGSGAAGGKPGNMSRDDAIATAMDELGVDEYDIEGNTNLREKVFKIARMYMGY